MRGETLNSGEPITTAQLVAEAPSSPLAGLALRYRLALAGIAAGGDRLKLQQIAIDALRGETAVAAYERQAANGR